MSWKRPPRRPAKQISGPITARETVIVPIVETGAPVVTEKLLPLRSESYRRFVASHPCFACGIEGRSQCAHANEGKGLAMKVSDDRTFPLCSACHEALDNSRSMTRDERRELERAYVQRMQRIAISAGRLEVENSA